MCARAALKSWTAMRRSMRRASPSGRLSARTYTSSSSWKVEVCGKQCRWAEPHAGASTLCCGSRRFLHQANALHLDNSRSPPPAYPPAATVRPSWGSPARTGPAISTGSAAGQKVVHRPCTMHSLLHSQHAAAHNPPFTSRSSTKVRSPPGSCCCSLGRWHWPRR